MIAELINSRINTFEPRAKTASSQSLSSATSTAIGGSSETETASIPPTPMISEDASSAGEYYRYGNALQNWFLYSSSVIARAGKQDDLKAQILERLLSA